MTISGQRRLGFCIMADQELLVSSVVTGDTRDKTELANCEQHLHALA